MKLIGLTLAKSCIENEYPIIHNLEHHIDLCDEIYVAVPRVQTDSTTKKIQALKKRLKTKGKKIKIVKLPWNDGSRVAWDYTAQYKEVLKSLMDSVKAEPGDWFVKMDADEFIHEEAFEEIRVLCSTGNAMHGVNDHSSYSTIRLGFLHFTGSLKTHQAWHDTSRDGVQKIFRAPASRDLGDEASSHIAGDGANFIPAGWSRVLDARHIHLYHSGYAQTEEQLRRRFAEHCVNIQDVIPGVKPQPLDMTQYRLAEFPKDRLPKILRDNFNEFCKWDLEAEPESSAPYFK